MAQAVMSDEKLTKLLRGYEELFDTSNRKYSISNMKESVWKPIGDNMQKPGHAGMKSHYAALPLSDECKNDLKAVQDALSSDARELNLRPSGYNSFQLTLGVFRVDKSKRDKEDEAEEELTESVNKILKDFLDKRPPLELTFGDLGNFGTQIVFINVMNVDQLEALRQDMNELLEKEGIYLVDRRFTPHVTMFRAGHNYGRGRSRHGSYGRDGNAPKLTLEDMVRRTDLPSVASSPVKQLVFKRLQGF